MTAPLDLRDATLDDALAISSLLEELGHPLGIEKVAANLGRIRALAPASFAVVAGDKGTVAGVVSGFATQMLHRAEPDGRVSVLIVAGSHAGRGIGTALLRAAEERLARLGCTRIEITSASHRADAHAFYRGKGYREQGVRFVREIAAE